MKTTRTRIGAALALVAALALPAHALDFNTVMVSGRPDGDSLGPQLADPTIDFGNSSTIGFESSTNWSINATGQVVFEQALETSIPVSNRGTIYRWTNGTKEFLARDGTQAIGMPDGVIVRSLRPWPAIADDGAVLFNATLVNDSGGVNPTNDVVHILAPAGGPAAPLVREGNNVPGIPGAVFGNNIGFPNTTTIFVPESNQISFSSGLVGPAVTPGVNDQAFFIGTRDSYGAFLRSGDSAPHVGPGVTYSVGVQSPWMVAGNYFVFEAAMNTPEATNVEMLHYKNAVGELSVLAKLGDVASGTTAPFLSFARAEINGSGKVALGATAGTPSSIRAGFYSGTPGNLKTLAYAGLPAPGTSTTFGVHNPNDSDRGFYLTESGAVAFQFRLTTGGHGIWVDDENGTRLALREGVAAGDLAGVTIGTFSAFAFNDNQNLAVVSALTGNVTTGANGNDQALWLVTPDGSLDLILRKGDLFDVDPSAGVDERQISGIRLSGLDGLNFGRAAHRNTFNDNNVLAFGLDFVGGTSGIFITDLTPIPEPSTLALVGLALASLATRRRR